MLTFVLAHGDLGLSCGLTGKESSCDMGDLGSIPGLGRCPGEGNGYPLQYSGLENSADGGAWQATVQGATENRPCLSDVHSFSIAVCCAKSLLRHTFSVLKFSLFLVLVPSRKLSVTWGD